MVEMSIVMSEYVLNNTVAYGIGKGGSSLELPAGAFIIPIDQYYLPKHIKDIPKYEIRGKYSFSYNDEYKFCYTRYGILPILTKYIRKIK